VGICYQKIRSGSGSAWAPSSAAAPALGYPGRCTRGSGHGWRPPVPALPNSGEFYVMGQLEMRSQSLEVGNELLFEGVVALGLLG